MSEPPAISNARLASPDLQLPKNQIPQNYFERSLERLVYTVGFISIVYIKNLSSDKVSRQSKE
jgi:hypothetical protein